MEKYKLTYINRFTTDKDGNPLVSKQGRPYTKLSIKVDKYGEKYLSGFGNKENANWKVGDEIEIEVKKVGEYLNFEMPKGVRGSDAVSIMLYRIEAKVDELLKIARKEDVETDEWNESAQRSLEQAVDEIDPADIPFN